MLMKRLLGLLIVFCFVVLSCTNLVIGVDVGDSSKEKISVVEYVLTKKIETESEKKMRIDKVFK